MRKGQIFISIIIFALAMSFANAAVAGDDWKAKQEEMFSQIPVKPGDKIDTSNWAKVKDILPPSVVDYVKKGDLPMTIGEFEFDMSEDAEWKAASQKNDGKYTLNDDKAMVEKASGKIPEYIYGLPFPNIDWKNDPNAGIKVMYNFDLQRARVGIWNCVFPVEWIGRDGNERDLISDYQVYYFWGRPDGPQPNPGDYQEMNIIRITQPYDIAGMTTLTRRYRDARADDYYAYLPSIRRVKKLSGANRSDPFAGSDFVNDDSNGWFGKNTTMTWKVLDKKVVLVPMVNWALKEPLTAKKQPDGAWLVDRSKEPPTEGFTDPEYDGAPWMLTNFKFAPREVYVIESIPKDPYYNYGRTIYYFDPDGGFFYKIIYDRADEYWKTMLLTPMVVDWGDGEVKHRTFSTITWYAIIDDKTDHCSSCVAYGNYRNYKNWTKYMDPTIRQGMFEPSQIATLAH